ncbi:MAG: DUF1501 domain-containing protein [Acidobacteria bacterium]|nr:DUF1501 domain-containing protein [Acidobacteriota bacterium]
MALNRRQLLQSAFGASAFSRLGLMNAWAQGPDYRALVCVFFFGGNDCNNTVIPMNGYTEYARSRGGLTLPQNGLQMVTARSGENYGLHPRLADLKRLFDRGKLAIIANVGMLVRPMTRDEYRQRSAPLPVNLFSHSDQQMEWQVSMPDAGTRTGWAGRAADRVYATNRDAMFTTVSLSGNTIFLAGQNTQPALVNPGSPTGLNGFNETVESRARLGAFQELLGLDHGFSLLQEASESTQEGLRISRIVNTATTGASSLQTRFPATTLGRQFEQVARLIKLRAELGVNRQIFFCSLGGFDTHINQLAAHDALMNQVGPALAAFYTATEELGVDRQVTTFTESEFGRTLQQSSGAGSDHGWGGHHFIMGSAVKGGELYGVLPTVATGGPDDATGRGVWVPTTSTDQYSATLAAWFGVPDSALADVFPNLRNFPVSNVGFMA